MAKSKVVRVHVFALGREVHTYICREYTGNRKVERHYTQPARSKRQLALADCIHLGALRGNTHLRPWLGGGLGWSARDRPFSVR